MTLPDPPHPGAIEPVETPAPPATRLQLPLLVGIFVAVTLACAYGFTLAPTIWAGDAGELITAAYGLGVPHAPGYPTFTLLGYVATHLPIGPDPAWRMNAMTALFAWGACLLVYKILLGRGLNPIWAGVATLGLGVGHTFWANAVVAEVYSLNLLLLAWFWLLLSEDLDQARFRWGTWLVAGLAITAHQTSIIAALVGLWALSEAMPSALRGRTVARAIAGFLIPCALYLYTYLAAQREALLVSGDPDTLAEWLRFTLLPGSQQINEGRTSDHIFYFGEMLLGEVWSWIIGGLGKPSEVGLIPAILGVVGLILHLRRKPHDPVYRCWAATASVYLLIFWILLRPSVSSLEKLNPYYLPVWVLLWLLVPEGYHALLGALERGDLRTKLRPLVRPILQLLIVLGVIANGAQSALANNRAGDTLVRESYTAMLHAASEDAVLLCNWDDLFPLWYLQRVEGLRPDVVPVLAYFPERGSRSYWDQWIFDELAEKHPDLKIPKEGEADLQLRMRAYIASLHQRRPILFTLSEPLGWNSVPMYPPFDFRALGVGWLPRPLGYEAVGPEQAHEGAVLIATLQKTAQWYRQGDEGVEVYRRWGQRYGGSYDQGYLLTRYMIGMVVTADYLMQLGESESGLDLYDRALALAPGVIGNYSKAASSANSAGDLERAIRYQAGFIDALATYENLNDDAVFKQFLAAQLDLASLKWRAGQPEEALALVADVLRRDPGNAAARELQDEMTLE